MAEDGAYSPDGARLAYSPFFQWEPEWKHYRGGQTTPIWIADLSDSSIVKVPRDNSNDRNPLWIGDKVYFLSDCNGPVTLSNTTRNRRQVKQLIKNEGFDIKRASAGPGAIVYEQFGAIYLYDLHPAKRKRVNITVNADMPQVRPHFEKVEKQIQNAQISPPARGPCLKRMAKSSRSPRKKATSATSPIRPPSPIAIPAWSPDGKSIAYFSDESGEYALHISPQNGLGRSPRSTSAIRPRFSIPPRWSPDSKKITYSDKRLNLWYIDLEKKTPARGYRPFDGAELQHGVVSRQQVAGIHQELDNRMHAVFVYSIESRKATQDHRRHERCAFPDFDKGGKYLYFTASTDMGLVAAGDMSAIDRP